MKKIILVNIALMLAFLLAFGLFVFFKFPFLLFVFGSLSLFMPSINIVMALDKIIKSNIGLFKISLIAFLTSLTVYPAIFYFLGLLSGSHIQAALNVMAHFIIWLLTLILIIIIRKKSLLAEDDIRIYRQCFLSFLPFGLIGIAIYLLASNSYFLLPEYDSYIYLEKIKGITSLSPLIADSRPLFIQLIILINNITGIQFFWIFKAIMPILTFSYLIIGYKMALENKLENFPIKLISCFAYLSFPILFAEIYISRPQTILIALFPIAIYLISSLMAEQDKASNIYWLSIITICAGVGVKIHELFLILLIICIFSIIYFLRYKIVSLKNKPWLLVFVATYIYLFADKIMLTLGMNNVKNIVAAFVSAIEKPKFTIWFLNGYRDFTGVFVSWPGYSWIIYYGYILGGFFLIILLMIVVKRKRYRILSSSIGKVCAVSFILFFLLAEIFPRLGLAFLIDRSWIFIVATFSLLIPSLLRELALTKKQSIVLAVVLLCSVAAVIIFMYIKQGWTTKSEYASLGYIQSTPYDSLIISQPGNTALITYFGDRDILVPPSSFFTQPTAIDTKKFIAEQLPKEILPTKTTVAVPNSETINTLYNKFMDESCKNSCDASLSQLFDDLTLLNSNRKQTKASMTDDNKLDTRNIPRNIYVLYSLDKVTGYYARYDYWRNDNFDKANLDFFKEDNTNFLEVFNNGSVIIWKYIR